MTAERFEILRRCFQKGLTVNLKNFQLYYKKSGKILKPIRYNNKDYVIINKQIWWLPMVIAAYIGLDVIGTTWIPKDGNIFNYHPGNFLLLTKEEKKIYEKEKSKTKFNWKDLETLQEMKMPTRGNYLKTISFMFGISLKNLYAIKYHDSFRIFGLSYSGLKRYNRMI